VDIDLSFEPGLGLPLAEHERARARGPIFWSDSLAGWVVWSYADVKEVLANTRKFSSEGTPISEIFGGEAMLTDDSPLHHAMRAVWEKHVSLSAMEARAADVRAMLLRLLEPIGGRLKAGETVDITDIFEDFTADGITWLMGMPAERVSDLKRWNRLLSDAPALGMQKGTPEYRRHMETRDEVYAFLDTEMDQRRAQLTRGERPQDMVGLMVAAEGHGGLTRKKSADNLLNVFLGAIDTTSKWLGNILIALHRQPELREQASADRRILPQVIEEVMRLDTVAQILLRLVRHDGTELAGRTLKAGEQVYVLPGAANRDPNVFANPDAFDVRRQPNPHVGFGIGLHHCLGRNIARIEALAFANAVLDLFPNLEIVDCDYGKNWAVWGPIGLDVRLKND
jgi:cytochrome P450